MSNGKSEKGSGEIDLYGALAKEECDDYDYT